MLLPANDILLAGNDNIVTGQHYQGVKETITAMTVLYVFITMYLAKLCEIDFRKNHHCGITLYRKVCIMWD